MAWLLAPAVDTGEGRDRGSSGNGFEVDSRVGSKEDAGGGTGGVLGIVESGILVMAGATVGVVYSY